MRCFLSYNKANKDVARSIGAHMVLSGLDVWFDEWTIQAGDSIPGKLNEGLAGFDAFVLLWSADSNRSNWVRQELNSALMRAMEDVSVKIIPCLLDSTPVPALISDRRRIDFGDSHKGIDELLGDLTGARTKRLRLLAITHAVQEMDVEWIAHPMLRPMLCCPKCGETTSLESWQQTDDKYDSQYAGMRCTNCNWEDGGEI
jgi:hypothetical protein